MSKLEQQTEGLLQKIVGARRDSDGTRLSQLPDRAAYAMVAASAARRQHWNEASRYRALLRVKWTRKLQYCALVGFATEELLSVSRSHGVVTPRRVHEERHDVQGRYEQRRLTSCASPGRHRLSIRCARGMAPLDAALVHGSVSPATACIARSADSFNPTYWSYLFRTRPTSPKYTGRSTGIRASRLASTRTSFSDIALLQPSRAEQDQIVAYLRAQDAHVARFIKAKRDLIALLTEQKLRIIDHAVTRGLDASVRLKPSGVDWLGDIPEHWELRRLKFLANNVTNQTRDKGRGRNHTWHWNMSKAGQAWRDH